jgi:hypothetical protein
VLEVVTMTKHIINATCVEFGSGFEKALRSIRSKKITRPSRSGQERDLTQNLGTSDIKYEKLD